MLLSKSYPNLISFIVSAFSAVMLVWSINSVIYIVAEDGIRNKSLFINQILSAYNFSSNIYEMYCGLILLILILFCTYLNLFLSSKLFCAKHFIFGIFIFFIYSALLFWKNPFLVMALISTLCCGISLFCTQRSNRLMAVMMALVSYLPMGILGLSLLSVIGLIRRGIRYFRTQEFMVTIDGIIISSIASLSLFWL